MDVCLEWIVIITTYYALKPSPNLFSWGGFGYSLFSGLWEEREGEEREKHTEREKQKEREREGGRKRREALSHSCWFPLSHLVLPPPHPCPHVKSLLLPNPRENSHNQRGSRGDLTLSSPHNLGNVEMGCVALGQCVSANAETWPVRFGGDLRCVGGEQGMIEDAALLKNEHLAPSNRSFVELNQVCWELSA